MTVLWKLFSSLFTWNQLAMISQHSEVWKTSTLCYIRVGFIHEKTFGLKAQLTFIRNKVYTWYHLFTIKRIKETLSYEQSFQKQLLFHSHWVAQQQKNIILFQSSADFHLEKKIWKLDCPSFRLVAIS